mgnify:CR=1 FL=1
MKKFLVTGGSGFIGSNFIHHIFHKYCGIDYSNCCPEHVHYGIEEGFEGIEVMNVDCLTYAGKQENLEGIDHLENYQFSNTNITDFRRMEEVFSEFKPDVVIHFAAESHVDRSITSGIEFVNSNVLGTQVLLDLSRKFQVELFVHISTDEVYGSMEDGEATEENRLFPSSPYSASKASSDLLAMSHHHTYGTPVIVTRCSNNFGPRQHDEKLIPKMISRAKEGRKLPVYGSGKQIRNWIHVKDHCEAVMMVINEGKIGDYYNIAGETEMSNIELIREILCMMGRTEDLVEYVDDRLGHDFRYGIDSEKLRKIGWNPRISLIDGLPGLIP